MDSCRGKFWRRRYFTRAATARGGLQRYRGILALCLSLEGDGYGAAILRPFPGHTYGMEMSTLHLLQPPHGKGYG